MIGCGGNNGGTPTPKPDTTTATTTKTTTETTVKTTTEKVIDTQNFKINFRQMTGSIQLPELEGNLSRRQVFVTFYDECAEISNPNFWYANKIGTVNGNNQITFELEQKSSDEI